MRFQCDSFPPITSEQDDYRKFTGAQVSGRAQGIASSPRQYYTALIYNAIQEAKFPYVSPIIWGMAVHSPYGAQDLGIRRNIESLLGSSIWLWWWPSRASGDGLSFPIVEDSGQSNKRINSPYVLSMYRRRTMAASRRESSQVLLLRGPECRAQSG